MHSIVTFSSRYASSKLKIETLVTKLLRFRLLYQVKVLQPIFKVYNVKFKIVYIDILNSASNVHHKS